MSYRLFSMTCKYNILSRIEYSQRNCLLDKAVHRFFPTQESSVSIGHSSTARYLHQIQRDVSDTNSGRSRELDGVGQNVTRMDGDMNASVEVSQ